MRLASYIISLCLHAAVLLLILYWPAPAPLRLDSPPIMISLVEGAPGGNRAPSPILGHMGENAEGPLAPAPPAPQSEVAALERPAVPMAEIPRPEQALPTPELTPEKSPVPVEQPKPREMPKPNPPKTEVPIPETPKPEPKKTEPRKPEPKKPEAKQPPRKQPPKQDPVAAALAQARKATSRANSGDRGNAVEQALAQARRNAGGNRGGGGGEGEGPGGGGLGDVYIGQVMLAVRPNWGFASSARLSLVCVVKVKVDMNGKVENAVISRSSGNAQYDASAVNAIVRTSAAGDFPPPPNLQYTDLDLVFTMDELRPR